MPQKNVHCYYAFGMMMPGRQYNAGDYRFGYNTQEKVDEIKGVGNHYTAKFWEYDSRAVHRWNIDPVVKPWQSSYVINGDNPIWRMDPNGDDDYKVGRKGHIKRINKTEDKTDRLFATNKKVDPIEVTDKSLLPSLSKTKTITTGSTPEGDIIEGELSSYESTKPDELFKVFTFVANNSDVEWRLDRYRNEGEKTDRYVLGTIHDEGFAPTAQNLGYSSKLTIAFVHSHPTPHKGMTNELKSMGYDPATGKEHSTGGDWRVLKGIRDGKYSANPNVFYYTYFPNSERLYSVEKDKPHFIRNIKADYRRFYFGALNGR